MGIQTRSILARLTPYRPLILGIAGLSRGRVGQRGNRRERILRSYPFPRPRGRSGFSPGTGVFVPRPHVPPPSIGGWAVPPPIKFRSAYTGGGRIGGHR